MIYLVRLSREIVIEGLSKDYITRPVKVIEGLPKGCELIAANVDPHGALILSFLKVGEGNDKVIFEQTITIETEDPN